MRAPKATFDHARRLRRTLSPPEARLWNRLRLRTRERPIFRRQHPIGPYILDFYCPAARLAIEIDGIGHDLGDRPERDARRDAWLEAQRIIVMRIPAVAAMRDLDETEVSIFQLAMSLQSRSKPHGD